MFLNQTDLPWNVYNIEVGMVSLGASSLSFIIQLKFKENVPIRNQLNSSIISNEFALESYYKL